MRAQRLSTEEKEAEIVRIVFKETYSHAEKIIHRLHRLQTEMSHDEAVDTIHSEITSE